MFKTNLMSMNETTELSATDKAKLEEKRLIAELVEEFDKLEEERGIKELTRGKYTVKRMERDEDLIKSK